MLVRTFLRWVRMIVDLLYVVSSADTFIQVSSNMMNRISI